MVKSFSTLIFAACSAIALVGAAGGANAGYRHGNCCGPIPPSESYSTVNKVSHVTRYHDEWRKNYVQREKLYIHVTRVQPIVYIYNVTRLHYETIPVVHPVHVTRTEYLPAREVYTSSVVRIDEGCVCDYCH